MILESTLKKILSLTTLKRTISLRTLERMRTLERTPSVEV